MEILPVVLEWKLKELPSAEFVAEKYKEDVKKYLDLLDIFNSSDVITSQILSIPVEDWYWLRDRILEFEDTCSEFCQAVDREEHERQLHDRIARSLTFLPMEGGSVYV